MPDPETRKPKLYPIEGNRAARYTFARRRIEKIANGLPVLTDEQRAELAAILMPFTREDKKAES